MKHFALILMRISGTVQSGVVVCCNAAPSILPRHVFAVFSMLLAGTGRKKWHLNFKQLKITSLTLTVQLPKALANL